MVGSYREKKPRRRFISGAGVLRLRKDGQGSDLFDPGLDELEQGRSTNIFSVIRLHDAWRVGAPKLGILGISLKAPYMAETTATGQDPAFQVPCWKRA
jgi:hypothetical protein